MSLEKIRNLFDDKNNWTRFCSAKDYWKQFVPCNSSLAVQWCVTGAAGYFNTKDEEFLYLSKAAQQLFPEFLNKQFDKNRYLCDYDIPVEVNDWLGYDAVIKMLDLAIELKEKDINVS